MVDLNREFLAKKYAYLNNQTDINLTCSRIKRIDSNAFQELANLETLWLPNNSIEEIDVRAFESLPNLKSLHLSNNKLKRINSNSFKNITKLETLWLNDNSIEEIGVRLFKSLSNLKGLYLYSNKLKEIDRKCFEPLKSIEVIILYENAGLRALSFIKRLTDMWYDEEKIEKYGSVSEWNRFLQQFPDLEISVDSSKQSSSSSFGLNLYERFEQIKVIGTGAYGIVYKVKDRNTGQHLKREFIQQNKTKLYHKSKAMKQIKIKDDKSKKEFINLMEINHQHVVKYFDHFYHTIEYIEHIFIITEYCEDGDLEKKICKIKAEEKKFSEKEIFGWILQATSGLEYLHSDIVRMVHRDIKPENMLLSKKNVLKLADLGVAKELSGTIGRTYAGTIGYMSPELERCKDNADREEGITYSFNTDVWSLGCVLYELIYLNKAFPQGFAIAKKIPSLIGCGSFFNFLQKMLVSEHHNRINSKELYELMMKSTFEITEDSSKDKYKDSYIGEILFDRYQVVKKIGKGAFGSVYLVDDIKINFKKYKGKAMKIMDQLDSSTENELFLFSEINHENIVRYFDHFHKRIGEENQTFLITEYCENGDLRCKIEEAKKLNRNFDERQILDWIFQATNALMYLHSKKPDPIIHRDIKPENILLSGKNEIKLGDLGMSKLMEDSHASTFAGTLTYMSPEVFKALVMDTNYYPNTDIWSLGCVLYELKFLTKAFPQGQKNDPPIPKNVSSSGIFSRVLPKMLEKDCLVRITSRQLFTELENLSDDY